MKTTKRINVPMIEGLEMMSLPEFDLAMEEKAAKFAVCENNWPEYAPYSPDCNGSVARTRNHLAVMFHVRGLDLRATAMEDNGRSWEDSCCEFFVADPKDGSYYNFELTCIGSLLAANGEGRNNRKQIDKTLLSGVKRLSSLKHESVEAEGQIFSWTVALLIPFGLIGVDPENLPETLRGNFYKCGDLTAHPHFLSWNPVGTPSPDFHRPDFFGGLILK